MTAHKHAALMAEYAKDAAETDKPWERWEYHSYSGDGWETFESGHPSWHENCDYRRKRVALCQVEGKDVFPGDKLWHNTHQAWVTPNSRYGDCLICNGNDRMYCGIAELSWSEPPKTKTVYQWAYLRGTWQVSMQFYASEEEFRKGVLGVTDFRRLDWTALEVPA